MPSPNSLGEKKAWPATRRLNLPKYSFDNEFDLSKHSPRHGVTWTPTLTTPGNARDTMSQTPDSQPQPPSRQDSTGHTPYATDSQSNTSSRREGFFDVANKIRLPFKEPGPTRSRDDVSGTTTTTTTATATGTATEDQSTTMAKRGDRGDGGDGRSSSGAQLDKYRDSLARDLERQQLSARGLLSNPSDKSRVSPIQEEATNTPPKSIFGQVASASASASVPLSGLATASSESGNTIRGGVTPGVMAGTPSYPFPRMASTPFVPSYLHRPFTTLSPTGAPMNSHNPAFEGFPAQDKVLSGSSTPASNLDFNPPGTSLPPPNPTFPQPNLYELSLMLQAEPGLDAWWDAVVHMMMTVFKAERVTLSVPADTTDIENVPWGQRATYNEHQEDELSMGYMARGSSMMPSSTGDFQSEGASNADDFLKLKPSTRPGLLSRHSFTTFEENKKDGNSAESSSVSKRPAQLSRSKSYFPPGDANEGEFSVLNKTALEVHDAVEEQAIPNWETPLVSQRGVKGRVLPVLQALDYEADPLIDHNGVQRVLDRGKVIALTRSYPYLHENPTEQVAKTKAGPKKAPSSEGPRRRPKKSRSESTAKIMSKLGGGNMNMAKSPSRGSRLSGERNRPSSIISRMEEDSPRPTTPKYEEYEQAPPSPWSQSPAPSPAVRPDPKENPFFRDAVLDEESFNPDTAEADYSSMPPPEAIGVDNSWTVLHVPLKHVLLSQTQQPFQLNSAVIEQKAHSRNRSDAKSTVTRPGRNASPEAPKRDKAAPIAILSILSPVIPYPTTLRHTLEHLSMHLATSFSLCRHYSNLEMELAGLQRRRPATGGFGAVTTDGRPIAHPANIANIGFLPPEDTAAQGSLAGSITSPSECSGVSRSAAGSPSVTPGGDGSSLGPFMEKRVLASSPLPLSGDSYFSAGQRPPLSRAETASGAARQRRRQPPSKESSPVDRRQARIPSVKSLTQLDQLEKQSGKEAPGSGEENPQSGVSSERSSPQDAKDLAREPQTAAEKSVQTWTPTDQQVTPKTLESAAGMGTVAKPAQPQPQPQPQHRHTMLHSYGADFNTTFPSLPSSSTLGARVPGIPSRSGSMSVSSRAADMPPPSDRLKGLILDSLPAHVFVALPQDGEIVWVNSRYLSYRGLTVGDLVADPWGSIHPEDRDEYLRAWSHSLRTGEQFSRTVRIRRFDGVYRWFYARAVASRDKRGVILQFLGSYMDIHDQHIAELKAARQEEIEASEAKHRLLANLIPQIIFTATENDGITFANEQWLSYTGQSFDDSLGLGFMDFVHPEDLAKCRIPSDRPLTPMPKRGGKKPSEESESSDSTLTGTHAPAAPAAPKMLPLQDTGLRVMQNVLSRNNSSSSGGSVCEGAPADLTELARKGIIKVTTDSSGRLSYTTEVRLRSKRGEYRWHLVRCVEIDNIDFGNGVSSYFGSATDINDHKLLEAKLKEAMESKSRFLSNMSHEIRTPLIGISGMVAFLQDTTLNEEQRDYTNTIQTSANSLLMIINDILDLSKVAAGMMKLKFEWFHTRSLIEDVNELVSTMAIAKRLELNYIIEEDVPAWVKGDKIRIRQVLLNVIGNAIKFTSQGEVFSRCKVYKGDARDLDDNEIMLEFAIIDTGRGFTKEEAELIFKPFSQIDGSSTRQHGGSGLGLVISRQLVELHGGRMEGRAIPGKGSTFTFTAKFALPTTEDHPDVPASPAAHMESEESTDSVMSTATQQYVPMRRSRASSHASPVPELEFASPTVQSSGSSDPSIRSGYSALTERSSAPSSVNVGLARFSEAARATGQDLSQMKLEMPSGRSSPGATPGPGPESAQKQAAAAEAASASLRPPMYSILIICPQTHSREATSQHIAMTLPKDVPHQITALATAAESRELLTGDDPAIFTHIVINLPTSEEVISLIDQTARFLDRHKVNILVLSDTVQRQRIMKLAAGNSCERLLGKKQVSFIYKPVKPSRFAVIFDPEKQRDLSIDRNRSSAQRMVESQKASYLEIERRMGNKGYRVLLVEDNPVNQKVLTKYLKKVGVAVDIAGDGEDCTEMVFTKPHGHYSLILCDLHMPRKDGYQACREIRNWESTKARTRMPIIALSANVMSDVQDKCVAAGFNDYVTKPVDFIDLSRAMSKFF